MLRNALLKRLWYKSSKTGILENDLLLGSFARQHLASLDERELVVYEQLLLENDWDIFYWVTGRKPVPQRYQESGLMGKLQLHASNKVEF